jgi:hypothetical protein
MLEQSKNTIKKTGKKIMIKLNKKNCLPQNKIKVNKRIVKILLRTTAPRVSGLISRTNNCR